MTKKIGRIILAFLIQVNALQAQETAASDTNLLNLPGDNLDLYATLDLFQKSKTIEEFESSLNDEETQINNLDLDLDDKVDFIKVVTKQEDDDFTFVLQIDVLEKETQDVAAIFVTKDKEGKVKIQMVGDEELYGENYIIEPKTSVPSVTANPGYSGPDTVVITSQPATVVVVEKSPVVVYMYSSLYRPYFCPYYYGYYPRYYRPYPVVSVNIYCGRHRYYRNRYYGGRRGGNTVIINNHRTYNNYSRSRNKATVVTNNRVNGNYKKHYATKKSTTKTTVKKHSSARPANKKTSHRPTNKPAAKKSVKANKNAMNPQAAKKAKNRRRRK